MDGMITDIQRFSLNDGAGIRTTVFLKGCPLHCAWCHNPECISPDVSLRYVDSLCVRCGLCEKACKNGVHRVGKEHTLLRERCIKCGACAAVCPDGALFLSGRRVSAEDVLSVIVRDLPYYAHSGGGVTFSGGEPLMQPEFLAQLLTLCRAQSIHTAVETSGFARQEVFSALLPMIDLLLFDCKETDDAQHRRFTGQGNALILKNLETAAKQGKKIILRCPLIPSCNLRKEHLQGILSLLRSLPISSCELMAYHTLGVQKYRELGLSYSLDGHDARELTHDLPLDGLGAREMTDNLPHGQDASEMPHDLPLDGHGAREMTDNLPCDGQGASEMPHDLPCDGHGARELPHDLPCDGHGARELTDDEKSQILAFMQAHSPVPVRWG